MRLDRVRVLAGPLSGEIYLAVGMHREGAFVATTKREVTAEVQEAFIRHMLHDMPDGAALDVTLDGERYEVTVRPAGNEGGGDHA